MQRRSFLKAVAMAVPAAGLQTFLVTQARAPRPLRYSPRPRAACHKLSLCPISQKSKIAW
jgi:hypothetical protein